MTLPQVLFSVGVRVPGEGMGNHAYQVIQSLCRHRMLAQAFVMQAHGAAQTSQRVRDAYFIEKITFRLSRYSGVDKHVLRDNAFDWWVSRHVRNADIFYGWTHHALWSLKRARRLQMPSVLERANSHPLTYTRLLADEYAKYGIANGPYHPLIFKKHLQELEFADYIAVTSEFTRQSLLEHGIDERRILLTPLGVDSEHFRPSPDTLPEKTFRVLYVGQIRLRKGVQYLLDAWNRLQLKNAELVLVGDVAEEFSDILQAALERDQGRTIRVCAHVDDPVRMYQDASVCILPTLEDGFGLVVLEAMACGIPVIITEHTGAKDCVRHDVDGWVLPPSSVESLADTLNACYRQRERLCRMGAQARQQAEKFSWQRYQDGIAGHLRRIAS